MELSLLSTILFFVAFPGDVRTEASHQAIIFTQVPAELSVSGQETLPLGARIARIDPSGGAGQLIVLTSDFAAAGHADVSFDGKRMLFVGRRAESDPTSVWEMKVDGSAARLITTGPGDCRTAIYLSTIYTMDADAPHYHIAFLASAKKCDPGQLFTCRLDGSMPRQITFAPSGVSDPLLISDGRLLCSMLSPVDGLSHAAHGLTATLMTLHVDGSELFPFAGQHEPPLFRAMPCETMEGSIIYVEANNSTGPDKGGTLAGVARTRSLHTRRLIARDKSGAYHSPSALPDGNLLVSYRPTQRKGGKTTYGIYELDPQRGTRSAPVFDDPQWHDIDAMAVHPRREPKGRSSVIKRAPASGESETGKSGHLYGLDVYLSNTPDGARIQRGDIEGVRVIQTYVDSLDASVKAPNPVAEVVLGEAPVEMDGSYFLEVPAQVPLRLETIGKNGNVLQRMTSWFWVMPGERRGCIGCHEDRELTPPNRHVLALRKTPHRVGVQAPMREGQSE